MVLKDATDKFRLRGRSIGRPRFLSNILTDKHRDDDTIMSYTDSSSCGDSPNSTTTVEVSSLRTPGSFANSLQPAEGSFPRLSYHSTTTYKNTQDYSRGESYNEKSNNNSQNGSNKIQKIHCKAVELIIPPPVSESLAVQSIKKEEQIKANFSNDNEIYDSPQSNSDCIIDDEDEDEMRICKESTNEPNMNDQDDDYFWINKQGSSISLLPVVKEDEAANHNMKDVEECSNGSIKTWSPGLVGSPNSTKSLGADGSDTNFDVGSKKKRSPKSSSKKKAAMEKELQARLKAILVLKDVVLKQKTEIKSQNKNLDECGKKITAFQNVIEYLLKVHQHDQKKVSRLQHERDTYAAEAAFYREKFESLLNENATFHTELDMFDTFSHTIESGSKPKSSQINVTQEQNLWKDSNTTATKEKKRNQYSVLKMAGNEQFHPHPKESIDIGEKIGDREDIFLQSNSSFFDLRDEPHNRKAVYLN